MKVRSVQGLALAGAAVALLAGCGGERAEPAAPAPAPAPPAAVEAAVPAEPAAPVEPSTKAPRPQPPQKPQLPVIGTVSTTQQLSCDGGWCTLPAGAGAVTLRAEVTGANRVEFFVVPTGTGTWDLRRSIGVDRDGSDGWSVTWAYGNEPVMAHLAVVARGPGGTVTAEPVNLVHE